MLEFPAPGLTADWLNAWLAAIGVTVLLPDARLRWTNDALPRAVFDLPDDSDPLADRIAGALPDVASIESWVLSMITGKVRSRDQYHQIAEACRATSDETLSTSITDLGGLEDDGSYPKAPFDPPVPGKGDAPGTGRTMAWRLKKARQSFDGSSERVGASLQGTAERVAGNGLGFDYRRISDGRTDPVIEVLAFEALRLFPLRGNGTRTQQRGWTARIMTRHAFRWPVWSVPLDRWAIDAVLDITATPSYTPRPPVTGRFGSVPYQSLGSADVTRGYASERVW